ncbi:flippase [bacterium]|nr:flippase [bacterium]
MAEENYLDKSLRKIAKGAGLGFTGTMIGMAFGYFSRIVIARFLGPGDYGLVSLGVSAFTIASTFSLMGLPSGVIRYISFYKGKEDEGRIKGTIISAIKMSVPLGIILTVLIFFGADLISIHIFHEPNLTPVLRIFSIAIPFWVLAQICLGATIGFQDLRYNVYVLHLFQNSFKLIAIVILLWLGFGVIGASFGWVLAIVGMPFLAFYFLENKVFPIFNTKIKSVAMEKELFLFSFPLIFVGMAGLITGWTDTIMLGYFSTTEAVGIYNAVQPTARLMLVALSSFGVIFTPVISELYARNKYEDLKNSYSVVTKWILALVFPAFLLMALFSKPIIEIMFGPDYIEGAMALGILAFGFLVISAIGPASSVLHALGRTKVIMGCSFIGAAANVVLNLLLIPPYGINGAAIATAFSLVLMHAFLLFFVNRIGKIQPFRTSFLKPIFASAIAVFLVYGMTKYLIGVSFFILIVMFFVFVIIYFLLVLLFKSFEEEDLMIMKAIDERLGTKTDLPRKIIKRFL